MTQLYIPEEDSDYLRCLQYVIDVEIENHPITVFAERLSISEKTVFLWKRKWIESGLLAAIRRQMALGPLEDLKAAKIRAVQRFPAVLERWIDIAESSKSDKVASEAAKSLWQEIVRPMLEEEPDVGSEEASFIKGHLARRIDPMSISREIKRGENPTALPLNVEQTAGKSEKPEFHAEDFRLDDNDETKSSPPSRDDAPF
jgi:hypothetical protein